MNFKPTYLNMDVDWENIVFSDSYNISGWNTKMFLHGFGLNLDSSVLSKGKIDPNGNHHWVLESSC